MQTELLHGPAAFSAKPNKVPLEIWQGCALKSSQKIYSKLI